MCTRVFQEFLLNMDDNVDETESVKRYNQYKLDFRRQQLQDFFLQHKDQEWFRSKYHPDDMAAKKAESLAALKTRLRVFLFLLDNSWLDKVLLDTEHAPSIIKVLDAGGHDEARSDLTPLLLPHATILLPPQLSSRWREELTLTCRSWRCPAHLKLQEGRGAGLEESRAKETPWEQTGAFRGSLRPQEVSQRRTAPLGATGRAPNG